MCSKYECIVSARPRRSSFARKRGCGLLRMARELAGRAQVASFHWDPADKRYRVAVQLPTGDFVPELSGLVSISRVAHLHLQYIVQCNCL